MERKRTRMQVSIMAIKMTGWTVSGMGSHLANYIVLRAYLRRIKNTLRAIINDLESCDKLTSINTMAPIDRFVNPPLPHGVCSLQAAEPCIRTATGSRCLIRPCQDFGNGFHFLRSNHYLLDRGPTTPTHTQRRLSSNSSAINLDYIFAMAHLRHRIRSRRGGTRGGFIRSQASTSSASDSPDSTTEMPNPLIYPTHHYPNTRSGRGRRDNVVHSMDFPLPPFQFHFRSSLNRPTIIATITISFEEESTMQAPLSSRGNK